MVGVLKVVNMDKRTFKLTVNVLMFKILINNIFISTVSKMLSNPINTPVLKMFGHYVKYK